MGFGETFTTGICNITGMCPAKPQNATIVDNTTSTYTYKLTPTKLKDYNIHQLPCIVPHNKVTLTSDKNAGPFADFTIKIDNNEHNPKNETTRYIDFKDGKVAGETYVLNGTSGTPINYTEYQEIREEGPSRNAAAVYSKFKSTPKDSLETPFIEYKKCNDYGCQALSEKEYDTELSRVLSKYKNVK